MAYNPPRPPSLDIKGEKQDQNHVCSSRVSAQLVKVLNETCKLEEKYATNLVLITTLKQELHHACATIESLLTHRHSDRKKIYDLRKKIGRQNKSEVYTRCPSVRREVPDEEVLYLRSSLSHAVRELEQERRLMVMLENLCDKFATAIKKYNGVFLAFNSNSEDMCTLKEDSDHMIMHVSESWLDERSHVGYAPGRRPHHEKEDFLDASSSSEVSSWRKSPDLFHPVEVEEGAHGYYNSDGKNSGDEIMISYLKKMKYHSSYDRSTQKKSSSRPRQCIMNEVVEGSFDENMWNLNDEMSTSCRLLPLVEGRRQNMIMHSDGPEILSHSFSKNASSSSDSSEYGA